MKLLISRVLEGWSFGLLPGVSCSDWRCRGDERASETPQIIKLFMTKAVNVSPLSLEPWIPQSTLIHCCCMKFDSLDGGFVPVNRLVSQDDYVQWVTSWNELH